MLSLAWKASAAFRELLAPGNLLQHLSPLFLNPFSYLWHKIQSLNLCDSYSKLHKILDTISQCPEN